MAFWAEQMSRIVLKMSGALVDTYRVAVGSHPRENEIKEALLSPFLSSVAHSASMLLFESTKPEVSGGNDLSP